MIKAIIFDWGGVLTIGGYVKRFVKNLSIEYDIDLSNDFKFIDDLFVLYDVEDLDLDAFCSKLKNIGIDTDKERLTKVLLDSIVLNHEMIDLLKSLKSNYKIMMLSDNNSYIVNLLNKNFKEFMSLLDETYFSYTIKIRKPDIRFFNYVIESSKLNPSECVFVDDKEKNVKGSEKTGMKGILFKSVSQLKKDLENLGVVV